MVCRTARAPVVGRVRQRTTIAQAHAHELPVAVRRALGGLGALKGGGGVIASYLLFEPGFVQKLVALGERDAYARKEELLAFFGAGTA